MRLSLAAKSARSTDRSRPSSVTIWWRSPSARNKFRRGGMAVSKNKVIGILVLIVGLMIAAFAGYTWITLHWSFSKGERVGYVQKLSQKGWMVKTWEGELQMLPVPGAMPEKFEFSVRDDAIAQKLNAAIG